MIRGRLAATLALAAICAFGNVGAASPGDGASKLPDALAWMFQQFPESLDSWTPEGSRGSITIQTLPYAGREDVVARFDRLRPTGRPCPPLPGNPFAELVDAALKAQIVIVNEAHDSPLHRFVIRRLGLALAEDIDLFAAETFEHGAVAERSTGRITTSLGSYSREPMFGRQLRALDTAGYRFIAYEVLPHQEAPESASIAEQVIAREEAQAENLIAEVLDEEPEARVLVHVGYSHALEEPVNNFEREIEWFAARLKRKTGIDPLTISQTHCVLEDGSAANALDGLRLVDGEGAAERAGAIDHFLAHPPLRFEKGRPAWRRAIGDVEVAVPERFLAKNRRVIIEARAPDQPDDEVPVERLLLYPDESLPLLLPPGTWRLTGWTVDGPLGDPMDIEVSG